MATIWIVTSILFLTIIQAQTQFFDFFQDLRPFTYQTIRPINPFSQEITTKRPKTTTIKQHNNNQRNKHTSTQETRPNTRVTSEERDRQTTREKQRRKTTTVPITTKVVRKSNSNHNNDYSTSSSNIRAEFINGNDRNNDFNEYNQPWQDTSNIIQEYTTKPNFGSRNPYTTYNPLYNRPGVKPAVINTNRPPITNKPATKNPFAVFPRPTDGSVIRYPSDPDDSPQVLTAPDEDTMSEVDKRRYAEVAERMCDKYKALSIQQVEAIPLLPSPETVRINITDCAPASVPLVVGGKVVNIREFPHMALLGWTKLEGGGYSWKCGGSLISDRYVLTAAHCSYQERDNSVVAGAPRVVQLGSSYLDDPGSLVVKVSSVYRHPKYTQSRSYYDVAMVKLVKAVSFSAVVKPACLGVPPPVGEKVIATGWGRTEFGGDQSLELRSVSISIWDMQDCKRILSATRKLPNGPSSDSQVCAGERAGHKDTCQGDSGGPAQVSEGCIWRVVGITSVGRSCGAANTPALYATVHKAFIAALVFADQIKNEKQNNFRNDNRPTNTQNSNRDNYQGNRQDYNTDNYRPNNNRQNYNTEDYQANNNRQTDYGINNNERNRQNHNSERDVSNTGNYGINNEGNRQSYNNDNYQHNNNRDSFNTNSYRPNSNSNRQVDNYQQNNNRESFNTDSYRPNNNGNRQTNNYPQNNRQTNNQDNYNRQQNEGNDYKNNRYSGYGSEDGYRHTNNNDNSGSTDYNNSRDSNNYYGTGYNQQRDNYRTSDVIYYPESK